MSADRTEHPTPKRLRDARKKGQIARSRDAGQGASLLATVGVLAWAGSEMVGRLGQAVAVGIRQAAAAPLAPVTTADLSALATSGVGSLALLVGPVAAASVVAAVAASVAQGGWNVASEAVRVDWTRLNPAQGFKRLGLSNGGLELLRAVVASALVAVLAWQLIMEFLPGSATLARHAPGEAAAVMWNTAAQLMKRTAFGLLLIAGGDYLLQRQKLLRSLRMTHNEVRDEAKLTEGNPEIKARVRRIQREIARRRMLFATKRATVVVTNPTHYAVALEYRKGSMPAPVVVAKGADLMAQQIRKVARENGVPIVENVQLARALYASAEVGDIIPGPLFEAVADVLAYLVRIKQLVL